MRSKQIAFLGLGVMGSPMACNVVKAGFEVRGWNRTRAGRPLVDQARAAGVKVVDTIAEAVAEAEWIATCVSDVDDVKQVIFGSGGVVSAAQPGAIVVDFSTIGTQAALEIAAKLQPYQVHFMDAPVSGGDVGAQNGTLTIMAGAELAVFEQTLPLLQALGKRITHCGPVGAGQAVKLCNQVLCAVHMVGLSEAIRLAEISGVDPNLMIEVCSTGAAGSWALSNLGPKIVGGDFNPGFMVKHILKDLRLVQESLGDLTLPGMLLANEQFQQVQDLGGAEQGTQAMFRVYRDRLEHPHN